MSNHQLIIFDTTLRDGEQSPGASMTKDEKVRIAKALEKLKVDIIEAGFAIASPGDFEAVKAVADVIKDSTVCSLARALDKDIDRAAQSLKNAANARIHTFIATSDIHMQKKLQMTPDQVVEQAVYAVKRARNLVANVEFSPEDAGRSDIDFLCRIIEATIEAGATTINIPDTVGYNTPEQFGKTIRQLIERIPNADKAIFSAHCHNDLGLAVANSLSAVQNGARQIECTINGLGERAGNTALEEVVMAVRTRQDIFNCDSRIDTSHIVATSRLVSSITGFAVQPNKAIVGVNAFAHEAGIHQDGVLKHRETYEIMSAEDVGWGTNKLVLGKHSGRNAFRVRMADIGVEFATDKALNEAFARFKDLADKKHEVFDDDLQALVSESQVGVKEYVVLKDLRVNTHMNQQNDAEVWLTIDGIDKNAKIVSAGSVDAIFKAINEIVDIGVNLQLYSVVNVTEGTDSLGEVNVRMEYDSHIVTGQGFDTDIVRSSAKAYINALNKIINFEERKHPQWQKEHTI